MAEYDKAIEETAQEITKEAIDLASYTMADLITPSAEEVKKAAQELVNFALELNKQANEVESTLDNIKNIAGNEYKILSFSKKMVKQKEDFKNLMEKVFAFQNVANAFLGQKVQMTFIAITPQGEAKIFAVDNTIEHMKIGQASSKKGGAIIGKYNLTKKEQATAQQIINSRYEQNGKITLDNTFKEVYRRYVISKNRLKLQGAAYILWKEHRNWDGAWIASAGPLGEGYMAFFVNEYIFSGMMESDIRDFMLNKDYGAIKADNASGFLQGDISKNGMEFGVKMKGASTLSYISIIEYAQALLQVSDIKQFLLDVKKELTDKASNNLVKEMKNALDKEITDITKPLTAMKDAIKSGKNY